MSLRRDFWSIYREALPILFVALGGGLFAGIVLEGILESVERFPGLLVMVPVSSRPAGTSTAHSGGASRAGSTRG